MSREIQEAYKAGYRKGYLDGFSTLQKVENESVDERSATKWANIPDAPIKPLKEDFRTEIANLKDEINVLEGRIRKLERAFYGD